jgi:hypothetical protein
MSATATSTSSVSLSWNAAARASTYEWYWTPLLVLLLMTEHLLIFLDLRVHLPHTAVDHQEQRITTG